MAVSGATIPSAILLCSEAGSPIGTSVIPEVLADQRWRATVDRWVGVGCPTGEFVHDGYQLVVRRVFEGDARFVVSVSALNEAPESKLTDRQIQVARYAANGATAREIAMTLGLSLHTVRRHIQDAYRRLEVASRVELARALESNRPPPPHAPKPLGANGATVRAMSEGTKQTDVERERDLYRALLELADAEHELDSLLYGVLDIVRELTGATQLYLQAGPDLHGAPPYWAAIGTSSEDVDAARAHLSRSILREALTGGGVVETACALTDERFDGAASVKANRVGGVICAALGGDPQRGLLYVQGPRGGDGLRRDASRIVATTARVIASSVEREIRRLETTKRADATTAIRKRFEARAFVGRSSALGRVLELAALAVESNAPVLLTGPSGTGKSLLAREIAKAGVRREAPFVEVNCAALPSTLVESELFGAARGAHSTANDERPGLVASAEGGTLFLDEIAELSMPAQAKLLHLTQTGTYHRLGDDVARTANVRVMAATNADLRAPDAGGRLRRDLYYRLAVLEIPMPGLDERRDDIALLAEALVERTANELGIRPPRIAADAIDALEQRSWPGNVRELRNAIELGLLRVRAEGGGTLRATHLGTVGREQEGVAMTLQAQTKRFQRGLIEGALREAEGRATVAAERLGISRSHLYHLVSKLGVERDSE